MKFKIINQKLDTKYIFFTLMYSVAVDSTAEARM